VQPGKQLKLATRIDDEVEAMQVKAVIIELVI
jgi:hypothetical protein